MGLARWAVVRVSQDASSSSVQRGPQAPELTLAAQIALSLELHTKKASEHPERGTVCFPLHGEPNSVPGDVVDRLRRWSAVGAAAAGETRPPLTNDHHLGNEGFRSGNRDNTSRRCDGRTQACIAMFVFCFIFPFCALLLLTRFDCVGTSKQRNRSDAPLHRNS